MKFIPTLDDLVRNKIFKEDHQLLAYLQEAESFDKALLYVTNFTTRKFEYMSPTCVEKVGYSMEFFLKGGADALYHLALPQTKLTLVEQQASYLADLKQHHDPHEAKILEFAGFISKAGGEITEFLCLSLILTYTPDRDVEFSVILLLIDGVNERENAAYGREILRKIKARHNAIFQHPASSEPAGPLTVIHISSTRTDRLLSKREVEVLKFLARGSSTQEIADNLGITDNTVETYRKRLLEKFKAKNTPELIKKASKVYWLE